MPLKRKTPPQQVYLSLECQFYDVLEFDLLAGNGFVRGSSKVDFPIISWPVNGFMTSVLTNWALLKAVHVWISC